MKDKFEHILQNKLQDFPLKAETDDWIKIERSLGLEKPKRTPLYRYVAAAAAVLLVGMLGFFLTREPELLPADTPLASGTPKTVQEAIERIDRSAANESEAIHTVLKLKDAIDRSNGRIPASEMPAYTEALSGEAEQNGQDPADQVKPTLSAGQGSETVKDEKIQHTGYEQDSRRQDYATRNVYAFNSSPVLKKSRTPNSNWALSLFADGSASGNSVNDNKKYSPYEMAGTSNGMLPSFDESDALVEYHVDGKNGLLKTEVAQWDHDLPLTFGFMLRRNFNERWGAEIGLTYSYLNSKRETENNKQKQKLHYLGIPVAVTYTPFRTKNFDFYLRAGGAADFNLSGKNTIWSKKEGTQLQSNSFTKSGVQWSVSGNIGAMYNISPTVGVYFEPGISHYFEFSNQPDSYWKEHPTNFNFKFGIRTNF